MRMVDILGGMNSCAILCTEAAIIRKESLASANVARSETFSDSSVTYLVSLVIQAVPGARALIQSCIRLAIFTAQG